MDETQAQPQGDAPAAVLPAPTPVDVEAIVSERFAQLEKEWEEKRIKPLQREISERDEAIRGLKIAAMSGPERAQFEDREEQNEVEQLKFENALLKMRKQNEAAVDFLERFYQREDLDGQFELIAPLFPITPVATPPAQPEAETQVPDVLNPNPPANTGRPSGGTQSDQIADPEWRKAFLRNMGDHWPDR